MDCVCSIYQLGKLFVGIQQCFCIFIFLYVIDLGLGGRIVSIVVTVGFLAEVVLWVTVVSAPTVHSDRVEMWLINFLSGALDIGLDFQFDEVIAQAVGNGLSKNVCTVQRYLVSSCDVVCHRNREGNASSGQFFHCLLFVLFEFFGIQTNHGFTIEIRQAHFFLNEFYIVGTVRGVNQTLHGVEVVFTAHWVNCIDSWIVLREIKSVVDCFSECFVSDRSVPVGIFCAVFIQFVVVKVNLIGIFISRSFNQILVKVVVLIAADGLDVCFCQIGVINLTCLIQLESNVGRLYHLDGNSVEQFAFSIPVCWVFGKGFLIALNVSGHSVAAVVPHGLVVHCFNTVNAQFIDHALCQWVQTCVCSNSVEIWFWFNAGINNGLRIRYINSNHFLEFRTFASSQSISFFFAQALGIFIVFRCAFDHFNWHRSVCRVIFVEVQYPLQTGCKVHRGNVSFFLSVHINPFNAFTKFKGPG